MTGYENICLVCGAVWITTDAPETLGCPECGSVSWTARKDDGLEYAQYQMVERVDKNGDRLLPCLMPIGPVPETDTRVRCKRCNYSWSPRTPNPRQCPHCHSASWNDERPRPRLEPVTCSQCGHTWRPRKENPRQCPRCQSRYWQRDVLECACVGCEHRWHSRVASPKSCPRCGSKHDVVLLGSVDDLYELWDDEQELHGAGASFASFCAWLKASWKQSPVILARADEKRWQRELEELGFSRRVHGDYATCTEKFVNALTFAAQADAERFHEFFQQGAGKA